MFVLYRRSINKTFDILDIFQFIGVRTLLDALALIWCVYALSGHEKPILAARLQYEPPILASHFTAIWLKAGAFRTNLRQ